MGKKINRRQFLKTTGTGLAAGAALSSAPLVARKAWAAPKVLQFLGGENVTGNWDPTANTCLANVLIETLSFEHCIYFPMRPGTDPLTTEYEVVESITPLSPFVADYKVRKGIKFHDGKDCLAEDIKATLEYACEPGRPRGFFPGQIEVEVIDSHTARVSSETIKIPLISAVHYLHPYICIMSAQDIKDKSIEKRINGTGQYKFIAQEGDKTILEANPDYRLGRPKIDRFIYSYMPDVITRVMALLSGEAQMTERLETEQYGSLSKNDKVRLSKTVSIENKYLHFRCSVPPFTDYRVRRAACHAIDRNVIVDIMGEAGTPVYNIMPRGKMGYTDLDNIPEYNPEKCQQLLAEAGFPKGKGLPDLEYNVSTGFYPKTKEYGEIIQAFLLEQGFPVTLNVMETAAWNDVIYKPKVGHLVDVGWAAASPEPGIHLNIMWHNPPAIITGLDDPDINASIEKQQLAPDLETRLNLLSNETYPLLVERSPSYGLFTSVMLHAMTTRLNGVHIYPDGSFSLMKADLT